MELSFCRWCRSCGRSSLVEEEAESDGSVSSWTSSSLGLALETEELLAAREVDIAAVAIVAEVV